jgi:biopolymer transport protein ExbB/TolQ
MQRQFISTTGDFERKKLDVNLLTIFGIAFIITLLIYLSILPIRTSFIGILLYDRGYTQPLAIYFASIVAALNLIKFTKLQKEFRALKRFGIPETILFENPTAKEIVYIQKNLAQDNYLITIRCSRVIAAYIQSGNRKSAAELALDDSSFYLSASESSYTFPRILIWAIPLLGFIGTVVGISEAVNGFSGLLEKAADIEQIKEGIGIVTNGLAVAFDTTLLALLLSVLVMIPLVLIERFETRLLLGIDIYINDQLLPRFKEKTEIDEKAIDRAIYRAIKDHLPPPEALVQPAREYAEQAATTLAQNFISEVSKLQKASSIFMKQIEQVNQMTLQLDRLTLEDRQAYTNALEKQQLSNQEIVNEIQGIVEVVKATHLDIAKGFINQTEKISYQLDRASQILANRIAYLEKATIKITEIAKLQESIEQILASLEKTQYLNQALQEVREGLIQLKPALEKLSKPRIITFVDQDERSL